MPAQRYLCNAKRVAGTMVTEADEALQTGGFFAEAKKGNWKTLNSFTHSGGMQLGRRFTQNDLAINYPDHELQYAVTSTLHRYRSSRATVPRFG